VTIAVVQYASGQGQSIILIIPGKWAMSINKK